MLFKRNSKTVIWIELCHGSAYMIPKSILILSMYFRYIYFLTTIDCIYVCTGSYLPTLRHLLTIPRPSSHIMYWKVDQEYVFEVHNQVLFPVKRPLFIRVNLKRMGEGEIFMFEHWNFVFFHCNSTSTSNHQREKLYPLQ